MKIALVANSTWNIYNFRQNVINKLLSEGHEVTVIAPIDEYLDYKDKYSNVKHFGLKTLGRDSTNPFRDLLLILELIRRYSQVKPDLVIHYTNKPNIYGAIAARIKKIDSVAIVTGLGYPFIHKGFIQNITSFLYKYTSKFHKKIIFENIADRELFEKKNIISKGKGISIKGCGVDINYFKPNSNGQVSSDSIIFTFIGRLLYDKGITEFVEAAKIIRSKNKNIKFWVVGDLDPGNPAAIDKNQLAEWVNKEYIEYQGFHRDVRKYIKQSDCIVLPSYREAIPRTITEGMAMGKPVISTDVAGCREAIVEDHNGYLVKVKSEVSLAKALQKFIELDPVRKKEMGDNGREKVLNEFDDRKIANQIYEIISNLDK
jgi:glycosyltransferase involved in cell wall biosynthesis